METIKIINDFISRKSAFHYLMINTNWNDEDGYRIEDTDKVSELLADIINGIPASTNAITRLSQEIFAKSCKLTDAEGLQHEVIHYGDLKRIIFDVLGWMI